VYFALYIIYRFGVRAGLAIIRAAAGLSVGEPPISDVEAGINRVIALLKERRLYIFNTCTGTIDQLGTYSRVLDENGQPTDKIKDKETYHYLDALRYVASGLNVPVQIFM